MTRDGEYILYINTDKDVRAAIDGDRSEALGHLDATANEYLEELVERWREQAEYRDTRGMANELEAVLEE